MHRPRTARRTMLHDAVDFVAFGIKALHKDDFTKCFKPIHANELDGSGVFYVFSLLIRYTVVLPLRIALLLVCSLAFLLGFLSALAAQSEDCMQRVFLFYIRVFTLIFGVNIKHHGTKRHLAEPHVFVANHTSFLDFIVLSSHKRSDRSDRAKVLAMVRDHVERNRAPMLIFPEGTCVNNKYTVLFQKGAFELDAAVCPVAIRYKKKLLDPYWNTSKHTFFVHLLYLMSRWKLDVDVYWMDPVRRMPGESAADFASRVKEMISAKAGLRSVLWNGYFKSTPVLRDRELLRESFRLVYNEHRLVESEKMKYIYRERSAERRIVRYEKEVCDIESEEDDDHVFYNYNYRKYLDTVLRRYISLKNDPDQLRKAAGRVGLAPEACDPLWLDTSVPNRCRVAAPCGCARAKVQASMPAEKPKVSSRASVIYERLSKYY
ncbi:UNVERIFIED_CONTAM: hypothetical protein PYX00_011272 [Menopon gallinae]|uniref:Phospholipid/glycerol acyltransferase domain-containing protein n=1 Tax=Menopon gallinae TaxID=328185 RepID=A0AAW2H763_9NEOP